MTFVNSIKLFGSNWEKVLKMFLYYLVIWAVTIALFLPVVFEFKNILTENFNTFSLVTNIFTASFGVNLHNLFVVSYNTLVSFFTQNVGLAVYGIIVLFVILPFLLNIGKYVMCELLYGYMASKSKGGFFSTFLKTLNKSVLYSLCKTFYSLILLALTIYLAYLIGMSGGEFFINYLLTICELILLVVLFTLNKITTSGWAPSIIVFGCSVFAGYRKGLKAVSRKFWKTLSIGFVIFLVFWGVTFLFGIYSLVVTVPLVTALLCMFDMTMFFTSQGMRYYVNENNILTPKKLEEVDNINKAKFVL